MIFSLSHTQSLSWQEKICLGLRLELSIVECAGSEARVEYSGVCWV